MRRMMDEALRAFLAEPRHAVVATVNRDGTPQQSPVSFWYDGRFFYFRSDPDALKLRNLRRDRRVSLCVEDPGPPERYVVVRGRAEFFTGDWTGIYYPMREKYGLGRDEAERQIAQEHGRVYVRIVPDSVLGADFSDEYE